MIKLSEIVMSESLFLFYYFVPDKALFARHKTIARNFLITDH